MFRRFPGLLAKDPALHGRIASARPDFENAIPHAAHDKLPAAPGIDASAGSRFIANSFHAFPVGGTTRRLRRPHRAHFDAQPPYNFVPPEFERAAFLAGFEVRRYVAAKDAACRRGIQPGTILFRVARTRREQKQKG
jgi:hypothetical protein